jgi:hypothetical protein
MADFGSDILIIDGEVIWNGDDIATVSGVDNVKQQAYLQFLCDRGESEFFPWYGELVAFTAGKPYTAALKAEVEGMARDGLLRVGDADGGVPWIQEVLECRYYLTTVDERSVRMLYAKFIPRGQTEPQEFDIEVGDMY